MPSHHHLLYLSPGGQLSKSQGSQAGLGASVGKQGGLRAPISVPPGQLLGPFLSVPTRAVTCSDWAGELRFTAACWRQRGRPAATFQMWPWLLCLSFLIHEGVRRALRDQGCV